jgi:hypothetical protein
MSIRHEAAWAACTLTMEEENEDSEVELERGERIKRCEAS